jgi:hypothetical protein
MHLFNCSITILNFQLILIFYPKARAIEILEYDSFIDTDDNEIFLCRIKKKSIEEIEA